MDIWIARINNSSNNILKAYDSKLNAYSFISYSIMNTYAANWINTKNNIYTKLEYYYYNVDYDNLLSTYNSYRDTFDPKAEVFSLYLNISKPLHNSAQQTLFSYVDQGQKNINTNIGSGATCRIKHCNQYNEYATPDQYDGTYICKRCKLLGDY